MMLNIKDLTLHAQMNLKKITDTKMMPGLKIEKKMVQKRIDNAEKTIVKSNKTMDKRNKGVAMASRSLIKKDE